MGYFKEKKIDKIMKVNVLVIIVTALFILISIASLLIIYVKIAGQND